MGDRIVCVEHIHPSTVAGSEASYFSVCNTNNHASNLSDTEYSDHISLTDRSVWLPVLGHLCGANKDTTEITIPARLVQTYFTPAKQFADAGVAVHRVLGEDFQDCAAALLCVEEVRTKVTPVPPPGWFVCTTSCSPKDVVGGVGPHYTLHTILMAVAASARCQRSLYYGEDLTLYLSPYDNTARTSRELRVFVCDFVVTAISQYAWTDTQTDFSTMTDDKLEEVARMVARFNKELVVPAWRAVNGVESYVMDVEYIAGEGDDGNDVIRLIELNSFGAEFSSGSCLFLWLNDYKALYEDHADMDPVIIFRVLDQE